MTLIWTDAGTVVGGWVLVEDWDLAGAGVAAARSLGSFLGSTFWTEDAAGEAGGAGRTGRAFHSFSRIPFDKDEWFAKGAQNEGVHTHLESVCILGDLAPFLVVVQRIEEDEVEVLERVKRVFVLVLREIRLDPIDAARLGNNLPGPQFERLCLDRGMMEKDDRPRNIQARNPCPRARGTCRPTAALRGG